MHDRSGSQTQRWLQFRPMEIARKANTPQVAYFMVYFVCMQILRETHRPAEYVQHSFSCWLWWHYSFSSLWGRFYKHKHLWIKNRWLRKSSLISQRDVSLIEVSGEKMIFWGRSRNIFCCRTTEGHWANLEVRQSCTSIVQVDETSMPWKHRACIHSILPIRWSPSYLLASLQIHLCQFGRDEKFLLVVVATVHSSLLLFWHLFSFCPRTSSFCCWVLVSDL